MFLIVPLLMLNGKWELTQDAVQAYYYAVVERDSLLAEADKLRKQNDSLKLERTKLISELKEIKNSYEENLQNAVDAKEEQDKAQEEITKYWKKLAGGFQLSAFTRQTSISNINFNQTQFGLKLDVPLSNKIKLSFQPTLQVETEPVYSLELSYRIF